ncbi:MAG: DUF559 domain-containing protein [Sphingomonas sp.]|jgi:very-short-patch-repair endonuclease|uniref:endonuclease domain-containing protein n=1 Tax=Sphingomonas sp. TaxID=28214 RepID=UPI0035624F58
MEKRNRIRELRNNPTLAERAPWRQLSARKIAGVRFNRQVDIGPFVADFASRSLKLVIEVDGGQHAEQTDADAQRTRVIESYGFRVIRFWNNDVLENLEGVVAEIERVIAALPSPDPSRTREGSEKSRKGRS